MSVGKISSAPNFEDFFGDQELAQSSQSEEENIYDSSNIGSKALTFSFLSAGARSRRPACCPGEGNRRD